MQVIWTSNVTNWMKTVAVVPSFKLCRLIGTLQKNLSSSYAEPMAKSPECLELPYCRCSLLLNIIVDWEIENERTLGGII